MKKLAALGCLLAALVAAAPAAAQMPDPAAEGPLQVTPVDYSAGTTLVTNPDGSRPLTQRLRGGLHFPSAGSGPYPVVVFQHGRHSSCETAGIDGLSVFACEGDTTLSRMERSYRGYDYIARKLASHGYVVMSVDTNDINDGDNFADGGIHARAMLLGESLDLLSAWNSGPGPAPVGTSLTGRLDMSRIGLMGHSRGGESVTAYVAYDRVRTDGPRHVVDAVLSLAPTDFNDQSPTGVAFATVLPYCDGDVFDLQGAFAWERSKAANSADGFPHIQWSVNSADHNGFNTRWESEDAWLRNGTDPYCLEGSPTRLSSTEQYMVGLALVAGFMRRYAGAESAFEPMMTGAGLPSSVCPQWRPVGPDCDDVVMGSHVAPAARRRPVIEPGATSALTMNAAGGALAASGFAAAHSCTPFNQPGLADGGTGCGSRPNRSSTRQLTLEWSRPATLRADIPAASADVSGYGALHLRAAANFADSSNAGVSEQDFDVRLTDAGGATAAVSAASVSAALEPSAGTTSREVVLNGIRIPLTAFGGVDLTAVRSVTLDFGDRRSTGSIQLADVAFQE